MIDKTAGIVLRQFKYTDSSIILHVFTESFGRLSLMLKSAGNKKSGIYKAYLLPLTIVDFVIYYKESREIQILKEFSLKYSPAGIYNNITKSTVALFMGEVLSSILREESPQKDLYTYIFDSVKYFNDLDKGIPNFHIAFLAGLCSYLGVEPARRTNHEQTLFDFMNGCFVSLPPSHGNYAGSEVSDVLAGLFGSSWDDIKYMSLNGKLRNEVLQALLKYYSFHFPSLKRINSLDVLGEVFRIN
ncbi:MAG: DNA repair protein RecO [Bacteroidales bacterium]|nr:DNA repair protein RecO [Bacteroidales bacterium]